MIFFVVVTVPWYSSLGGQKRKNGDKHGQRAGHCCCNISLHCYMYCTVALYNYTTIMSFIQLVSDSTLNLMILHKLE